MDEIIGRCGITCSECGAFIATKNNDDAKRKEVAEIWSKQYGSEIKSEDIYCDGCISEGGYHFNYCTVCELRKCGVEKGLVNCAHCDEFACEKLEKFFEMVPEAKKTLEGIRANL